MKARPAILKAICEIPLAEVNGRKKALKIAPYCLQGALMQPFQLNAKIGMLKNSSLLPTRDTYETSFELTMDTW